MKEKIKTKIYDRKDGLVKIYNGHLGTFVWEDEKNYEQKGDQNERENKKRTGGV